MKTKHKPSQPFRSHQDEDDGSEDESGEEESGKGEEEKTCGSSGRTGTGGGNLQTYYLNLPLLANQQRTEPLAAEKWGNVPASGSTRKGPAGLGLVR